MNVSKYGINLVLSPTTSFENIQSSLIQVATRRDIFVRCTKTTYTLHSVLGRGSYGTTYQAVRDDEVVALKVVQNPNLASLCKESIIQILLMKESEQEENGPFVPRLYEIAFNRELDEAYIVSERMTGTLFHLIQRNSKQENDRILPGAIQEIANSLQFLGERLKFNHRDLKPDNIMYTKTPYGAYSYKLIDFGLSCLRWNGLKIQNESFFPSEKICFKKDRDIPQLLYSIIMYIGRKHITDELLTRLDSILVSKINQDRNCFMIEGCTTEGLKGWANTYDFLNRDNVTVPSGSIDQITRHMNNFRKGKQFINTNREKKRLFRNNARKLNRNLLEKI